MPMDLVPLDVLKDAKAELERKIRHLESEKNQQGILDLREMENSLKHFAREFDYDLETDNRPDQTTLLFLKRRQIVAGVFLNYVKSSPVVVAGPGECNATFNQVPPPSVVTHHILAWTMEGTQTNQD